MARARGFLRVVVVVVLRGRVGVGTGTVGMMVMVVGVPVGGVRAVPAHVVMMAPKHEHP
jgi:hypothetical protein